MQKLKDWINGVVAFTRTIHAVAFKNKLKFWIFGLIALICVTVAAVFRNEVAWEVVLYIALPVAAVVLFIIWFIRRRRTGKANRPLPARGESEEKPGDAEESRGKKEITKEVFLGLKIGLKGIFRLYSEKDAGLAAYLATFCLLVSQVTFVLSLLGWWTAVIVDATYLKFVPILLLVFIFAFVGYFLCLLPVNMVKALYRTGWTAMLAHAMLLLAVLELPMILFPTLIGLPIGVILIAFVVSNEFRKQRYFFSVAERNAKFIMYGDQPAVMPWTYTDFCELTESPDAKAEGMIHWSIFPLGEIYVQPDAHAEHKLINLPRDEQQPYRMGKKTVWFKRARLTRKPRLSVNVHLTPQYFDGAQLNALKKTDKTRLERNLSGSSEERKESRFPRLLKREDIFFTLEGEELNVAEAQLLYELKHLRVERQNLEKSLATAESGSENARMLESKLEANKKRTAEIENHEHFKSMTERDVPQEIKDLVGMNFWAHARGFYFKETDADDKSTNVFLRTSAVIESRVVNKGIPAIIRNVGFGDAHLFSTYFYLGPPKWFRIYTYSFRWQSPSDFHPRGERRMDHVRLNDDIYKALLEGAEDEDQMRINLDLVQKIRVINPYLCLFKIEHWLENLLTITLIQYRQLVSESKFQDIYRGRDQYGADWWGSLQETICDPQGEDLERRYGARILTIKINDVSPTGANADQIAGAQARVWLAEREAGAEVAKAEGDARAIIKRAEAQAQATIMQSEADAKAIENVYERVIERGELGMKLRQMQTMERASAGKGSTIFFGAVETALKEVLSRTGERGLRGLLSSYGIGDDVADQIMELLESSKRAKTTREGGEES